MFSLTKQFFPELLQVRPVPKSKLLGITALWQHLHRSDVLFVI